MSFWIVTDACCDLPASYINSQSKLLVVPMSYQLDNEVAEIEPLNEAFDERVKAFYQKLRSGSSSSTAQINQQVWTDYISPLCEAGDDVLILAFSSALSGTCDSAMAAAKALCKKYPERKVLAVDTLAASLGSGLYVDLLLKQRDQGKGLEECYKYALDNVQRITLWFTVDDLHFLRRGGRVSVTSAYIGSILKIKPVLNVNPKGKLIPREKVQGRKRSLHALFEKAKKYAFEPEKQTMFISHGDCLDDALWLAGKLKTDLNVPDVLVSVIGPVIGSHSGPDTVALFFMGKDGEGRLT